MMTDSSEARYQQKLHPGVLCAVHPETPFDHAEKAYWLQRDAALKTFVDQWVQKAIDDANAVLKETPDDKFTKTLNPWLAVIQHSSEHYGQLVVYYRNNGVVPPESRPKKS